MNKMIPWSFIRERAQLSWNEAALGYHNQWLSWNSVIELACDRISDGEDDVLVIALAGLSKDNSHYVGDLLDKKAHECGEFDIHAAIEKWIYLRLAWLYENKEFLEEPLEEIENIYADFEYPEEMESFVRYLPSTDGYNPSLHSLAENESRLINNWKSYIDRKAKFYNIRPA